MIKVQTRHGEFTIPVKYLGKALAVHRPVESEGKLSSTNKRWVVTHIESGLAAGYYHGLMRDAIKLAKAWDSTFQADLPGSTPAAKDWCLKDKWTRQVNGEEPIQAPNSFEAILNEYVSNL